MSSVLLPEYREEAFVWAETSAMSHATSGRQRELLKRAFTGARAKDPDFPLFIHFPRLVYGLFCDDIRPAVPMTGVTTLFFMGIDLFDDVADGDLPQEVWEGAGDEEVSLAAATLFFSLPLRAVGDLKTKEITKSKMQAVLGNGFFAMASGQHTDLFYTGAATVSPKTVEESVMLKTGEELATFARLAALYADAPDESVDRCAALGKSFGTAMQLVSDAVDIFVAPWSRDLAKGTRTLPVALYLDSLDEAGREDVLKILALARTDRRMQEVVRGRLIEGGVLQKMACITEMYCGEALMHLDMLGSARPSAGELRSLITRHSFFSTNHD
jgi:geranylgeranyl pyrophosphate synthase